MMTGSTRIKLDNLRKYNGSYTCRFDYEKFRVGAGKDSYPSWATLKKHGMLKFICPSYCYRDGIKVPFNSYRFDIK